jgi:hypothetical protein
MVATTMVVLLLLLQEVGESKDGWRRYSAKSHWGGMKFFIHLNAFCLNKNMDLHIQIALSDCLV